MSLHHAPSIAIVFSGSAATGSIIKRPFSLCDLQAGSFVDSRAKIRGLVNHLRLACSSWRTGPLAADFAVRIVVDKTSFLSIEVFERDDDILIVVDATLDHGF